MNTEEDLKSREALYFIVAIENYNEDMPMGPFKTLGEAEDEFKELVAGEKWDATNCHFMDSLEDFKEDSSCWSDTFHIVKTVKIGTFKPVIEDEKFEFQIENPTRPTNLNACAPMHGSDLDHARAFEALRGKISETEFSAECSKMAAWMQEPIRAGDLDAYIIRMNAVIKAMEESK